MTTPREPVPPTITGLPFERRILEDRDRGVERVEIHVQDRLGRPLASAHDDIIPRTSRNHHLQTHQPAEPGLACHSRRSGLVGRTGPAIASRSVPSARARCSAVRSQTSSATTLTPRRPVRRTCPHTTIANAWNTVLATFGCTDSKTVTSRGPVPSSSVTKMIRWPLRIAGVCEETFTPATITHSFARHRQTSSDRVTPRSRSNGS